MKATRYSGASLARCRRWPTHLACGSMSGSSSLQRRSSDPVSPVMRWFLSMWHAGMRRSIPWRPAPHRIGAVAYSGARVASTIRASVTPAGRSPAAGGPRRAVRRLPISSNSSELASKNTSKGRLSTPTRRCRLLKPGEPLRLSSCPPCARSGPMAAAKCADPASGWRAPMTSIGRAQSHVRVGQPAS